MPNPYSGDDPYEWIDHFQLSEVLKERFSETLDINSFYDVRVVFRDEFLYRLMVEGLSQEDEQKIYSAILCTEELKEIVDSEREHWIMEVEKSRRRLRVIIRNHFTVDFVFLVDCTTSMGRYVGKVKAELKSFVDQLRGLHNGISICVGVVAYRDYCDGDFRLELQHLTDDMDIVVNFISNLKFAGGGDPPEDVLGGMNAVCKAIKWRDGKRVLYHICDAPCHGTRFHSSNLQDDYPDGDTVNNITAEDVLLELQKLNVKYYFFKIRKRTDIMIRAFNALWTSASPDLPDPIEVVPFRDIGLIDAVWRSTSSLVSSSIMSSRRQDGRLHRLRRTEEPLELSPIEPDWTQVPVELAQKYSMVFPDRIESLKNCISNSCLENSPSLQLVRIQVAPRPFAREESERPTMAVSLGMDGSPDTNPSLVVLKESLRGKPSHKTKALYESFLSSHRAAMLLAEKFNQVKPEQCPRIQFCTVSLLHLKLRDEDFPPYLICEERLEGHFEKYNTNIGAVAANPTVRGTDHNAVQAFCHWTHTVSQGQLLVGDCQGCYDRSLNTFLLTDPSVCSTNGRLFGSTNFREPGMDMFFETHQCNDYCIALELECPRRE